MSDEGNTPLYPVTLKLEGRQALVVGGGPIALRKAGDLLACGALVRVVAPAFPADFNALEAPAARPASSRAAGFPAPGRLVRRTRAFQAADLDGVFIVVAATDDPVVQQAVAEAAAARNVLCNVVDVNDLCSFYVPATLRRGALAVSVSTDGRFPLLAVALRDHLSRLIGEQFGPALERLHAARLAVRSRWPQDAQRRSSTLRDLLNKDALQMVLDNRTDEFARHETSWQTTLRD
jgi:precorrin-2 dehydrogenase/sirohydrochlorin ferrochelatase